MFTARHRNQCIGMLVPVANKRGALGPSWVCLSVPCRRFDNGGTHTGQFLNEPSGPRPILTHISITTCLFCANAPCLCPTKGASALHQILGPLEPLPGLNPCTSAQHTGPGHCSFVQHTTTPTPAPGSHNADIEAINMGMSALVWGPGVAPMCRIVDTVVRNFISG